MIGINWKGVKVMVRKSSIPLDFLTFNLFLQYYYNHVSQSKKH